MTGGVRRGQDQSTPARRRRREEGKCLLPGPAPPLLQKSRSRSAPCPGPAAGSLRGGGMRPAGRPRQGRARAPPARRSPCPSTRFLRRRLRGEGGAQLLPPRPAPAGVGEAAEAPPAPPTPEAARPPRGHLRRWHNGSPSAGGGSASPLDLLLLLLPSHRPGGGASHPQAPPAGRAHSPAMPAPAPPLGPLRLGAGRPALPCRETPPARATLPARRPGGARGRRSRETLEGAVRQAGGGGAGPSCQREPIRREEKRREAGRRFSRELGGAAGTRCPLARAAGARPPGAAGRERSRSCLASPRPTGGDAPPPALLRFPCGPPPFDSGAGRSGLHPRRRQSLRS